MSRVFIVEMPKSVDVGGIGSYGAVTELFGQGVRRVSVLKCDVFMREVAARLRELRFDPAVDKFCVTPPILPSALALATVCRQHPSVCLVVFNASTGRYEERRVNLESICTVQ